MPLALGRPTPVNPVGSGTSGRKASPDVTQTTVPFVCCATRNTTHVPRAAALTRFSQKPLVEAKGPVSGDWQRNLIGLQVFESSLLFFCVALETAHLILLKASGLAVSSP